MGGEVTQSGAATRSDSRTPPRAREADIETADGTVRTASLGARPNVVGRYTIGRPLGAGGMGVVFEAHDPELGRNVAVKLLRPGRAGSKAQARLVREAHALARLSHPNVVQVHDAGLDGDRVFVAMELVAGQTLREWLETKAPSWRDVIRVFVQAGHGLAAAHDAGLVHRDFKPSNVIVPVDGPVRVVDFGLASSVDACTSPATTDEAWPRASAELTRTGVAVGTPVYMAPEQHAGMRVDAAADQFSFCVALFEALYGARPFPGEDSDSLATAVLEGNYREPPKRRGPAHVLAALQRGLARDAADRYPSLEALLCELARDPAGKRRRWASGIGIVAIGVGVGGAVALADDAEACADAPEIVAATWNPDRRAALERAYADRDAESAELTVLVSGVDAYADRWVGAHREACQTHQDGRASAQALDGGMACLGLGLAQLDQALLLLSSDAGASLDTGSTAVSRLPAPQNCVETQTFLGIGAAASESASDGRVAVVRTAVVRATAAGHVGLAAQADAELHALAHRVSSMNAPGTLAEVQLAIGKLAIDRQDYRAASDALDAAAVGALEANDDTLLAHALVRTAFTDAMTGNNPNRALAHTGAILRRLHGPRALHAMLANNRGVAFGMTGDSVRAAESFTRAVELSSDDEAVDPIERSGFLANLALVTQDSALRDRTLAEAYQLARERLGANHSATLKFLLLQAQYADDPRASARDMRRVCEARARTDPDRVDAVARCALDLAGVYEELGETERAAATLRDVIALEPAANTADVDGLLSMVRGHLALLEGDAQTALVGLRRARADFGELDGDHLIDVDRADVTRIEAAALRSLGRLPEIRDRLELALAAYEKRMRWLAGRTWRVRADTVRAYLAEIDMELAR